jgi:hypothetical protein
MSGRPSAEGRPWSPHMEEKSSSPSATLSLHRMTSASCFVSTRLRCLWLRKRNFGRGPVKGGAIREPSLRRWRDPARERLARLLKELPVTAAARKTARGRATPPVESSVYDGPTLLGTITPRAGLFAARSASGLVVGRFDSAREAMRAICAASRGERAPQSKILERSQT